MAGPPRASFAACAFRGPRSWACRGWRRRARSWKRGRGARPTCSGAVAWSSLPTPRGRCPPRGAAPHRVVATVGMPVDEQGVNQSENLNTACRSAVLNMIALLQERGFTREQAYVICSVAVDLRISNVVDVPNYVVSALLPEH